MASQSKLLNDQLKQQNEFQNSVAEAISSMNRSIEGLSQSQQNKVDKDGEGDKDYTMDDADLESMPRRQFMDLLGRQFNKMLDTKLQGLQEDLDKTRNESVASRVEREVEQVRRKHKDFDDWKGEIGKTLQKNPSLGVEDALIIVRERNPDKYKELQEKYKEPDSGEESKEGSGKESKSFGGIRSGAGDSSKRPSNLGKDEAAEAAWEETMGDLPDGFLGGEA